jgi:hypothetical protein
MVYVKPVGRWTAAERKRWDLDRCGFPHFAAANITPIVYLRVKPDAESLATDLRCRSPGR